jgi:aryl-alcohol dehydrogenase-like predicted oxidoreductase
MPCLSPFLGDGAILESRTLPEAPRLDLPPVVLGCGNFGGVGSAPAFFGRGESEEEAFAIMDAAWESGLHWLDTADAYGGGRSEAAIGAWIRATGNLPRITTKTFNPMGEGEDSGLGRGRVLRQLASSLERLGVGRVDLYLMHEAPDVPAEEAVAIFEELVSTGRAGAWGASNVDGPKLEELLRFGRPAVVQNSYSLLDRRDEADVIPLCREQGVAYQAFSPLAGGWLTGKYLRGQDPPPGSRMAMRPEPYRHLDDDRVYDGLDALARHAAEHGVSTAGLALAWLVASPDVASIVVGPRRPEHLEPVREAREVHLTADERDALSSLFP